MKLLIVLSLMFIWQVAVARVKPVSQQAKLKAIFGNKAEHHLAYTTRHLIMRGVLLPSVLNKKGSLMEIEDSWPQLLKSKDRLYALIDIAHSPEHLEEAKGLLAEYYGEEHGQSKYRELVDLLFIHSQLSKDDTQILLVKFGGTKKLIELAEKEGNSWMNFTKKSAME